MRQRVRQIMKLNLWSRKNLRASDFVIVAMVTILVIFGVVMVFSASYYKSINEEGNPYYYLIRQGVFALTGFVIMAFCSYLDYHIFRRLSILILAVSFILLLLVLTPLGREAGGATRALYIGFTIMPGEIAKAAVIIFTASFLASDPKIILSFRKGVLPLLILMGVFGGLIVKQPNLSTAITVCGIIAGIMFLAGLQWRYVIGAAVAGSAAVVGLIAIGDDIGMKHWKKRIVAFTDRTGSWQEYSKESVPAGTAERLYHRHHRRGTGADRTSDSAGGLCGADLEVLPRMPQCAGPLRYAPCGWNHHHDWPAGCFKYCSRYFIYAGDRYRPAVYQLWR